MWAIATVQRSGTHVCTLRRRGLQHALLRVATLAHVDDFKIVKVRAPLVVAARAATAKRGRKQVGEDLMRLGATVVTPARMASP